MLTPVTEGVWVHQSECIETNGVVVQGADGVLLVDPGLTERELTCLAADLRGIDQVVVAGFSTHPHWDHALWHSSFGDVPRYATASAAVSLKNFLTQVDWREQVAEGLPPEIADEVPMHLFGEVTGLPVGASELDWNGPGIRILEHRAHAEGHAALLVVDRGVLIAGDMLSDVLVPMLDLRGSADPIGDYLRVLELFDGIAGTVDHVIPGHGSAGGAEAFRDRVALDRRYTQALRDDTRVEDPRLGGSARVGWEWVGDVHSSQVQTLAEGISRNTI